MTEKIEKLLEQLRRNEHRGLRRHLEKIELAEDKSAAGRVENLKRIIAENQPMIFENDRFGFNRSVDTKDVGSFGTGNVTPNYYRVISKGFDVIVSEIKKSMKNTDDEKKLAYGQSMLDSIDVAFGVAEGYRELAEREGVTELAQALSVIPHKGAKTLYEALVFMKLCTYIMRACLHAHITLGRFDQYMYPYFKKARADGMSQEEILELIEEFFITLNRDSDLYFGLQQGDNGQSMVLGGYDKDGNDMYNELSELCMKASLELSLIDPKINLRVNSTTPDERYAFATHLTKAGLGFPQYCNDDIVIPGLVKLGYSYEDALDYAVAACWEFIVPGYGADIPNIHLMDFPHVVDRAIKANLLLCDTFDELLAKAKAEIATECDEIIKSRWIRNWSEGPFLSLFAEGCIESLTDMFSGGTRYLNYGSHGCGIANAADALAAVKKTIYEDKTVTKEELLSALENNFEGYTKVRNLLRSAPKMGNNDDFADDIATEITRAFADNLNGRDNNKGGIWRAGTGSAMGYITSAEKCPATADGRGAGEPYSSSYSPSIDVKPSGLLSTIQSFTKFDFTDIINGGPLTIEVHDTVLKNDMGIEKVAMLVKEYINLGGHQLQINSINRDRLIDAQAHPEKYPNLIVRVWGWSGYFNELDVKYQNHIIKRLEYTL